MYKQTETHYRLVMDIIGLPLVRQSTKDSILKLLDLCCTESYDQGLNGINKQVKLISGVDFNFPVSILNGVIACASDIYNDKSESDESPGILGGTTITQLGFDSLDKVELIMAIEEEFNINLEDNIDLKNVCTIDDLALVVAKEVL